MERLNDSSGVMQLVEDSVFTSCDIRAFPLTHRCVLSQCPGASCYLGVIAGSDTGLNFFKSKEKEHCFCTA